MYDQLFDRVVPKDQTFDAGKYTGAFHFKVFFACDGVFIYFFAWGGVFLYFLRGNS